MIDSKSPNLQTNTKGNSCEQRKNTSRRSHRWINKSNRHHHYKYCHSLQCNSRSKRRYRQSYQGLINNETDRSIRTNINPCFKQNIRITGRHDQALKNLVSVSTQMSSLKDSALPGVLCCFASTSIKTSRLKRPDSFLLKKEPAERRTDFNLRR